MEFLSNPLEINFEFKVNDEKAPAKSMCYSAEGYTFQVIVITRDSYLGCYVAVPSEPYVNINSAILLLNLLSRRKSVLQFGLFHRTDVCPKKPRQSQIKSSRQQIQIGAFQR